MILLLIDYYEELNYHWREGGVTLDGLARRVIKQAYVEAIERMQTC